MAGARRCGIGGLDAPFRGQRNRGGGRFQHAAPGCPGGAEFGIGAGRNDVLSIRPVDKANGAMQTNGAAQWELQLRENADPQSILQFCFEQRIRLHSFNQSEPTLHEVFVQLVGPEAKEAGFR